MFERYTEPARRALFFARYEATQLGSDVIAPEHLLLGVVRESSDTAGRILSEAGLTLETLRDEITRGQSATRSVPASVEIAFNSAAKRVLTSAAEEADRLLHADIGPEHLLLGILGEEQSAAARVLTGHGLSLPAVRDRIVQLRSDHPSAHVSGVAFISIEAGVHIAPSRQPARVGTRSSFVWTIAGARLRGILAKVHDIPESHVDMPAELDTDTAYDVSLVLARIESAETIVRQMREGLERRFQIAIALETRATDVYVVTAASGGIRAIKHADEGSGGLGAYSSSSAAVEKAVLYTKSGAPRRPPWPIGNLSGVMSIRGLCDMLERGLGRPILDETKLTGMYEFDVRTDAETTEALLDALRERVGLMVTPAARDVLTLTVRPRPA